MYQTLLFEVVVMETLWASIWFRESSAGRPSENLEALGRAACDTEVLSSNCLLLRTLSDLGRIVKYPGDGCILTARLLLREGKYRLFQG